MLKNGIEVTHESPINIEGAGFDTARLALSLSPDAWGDLSHADIEGLINALPTNYKSALLFKMAEFLLSSNLQIPQQNTGLRNEEILLLRAEKLHDMGLSQAAFNLLNQHKTLHQNKLYLKLKFEQNLLQNNIDAACSFAQNHVKNTKESYWKKALITCQILKNHEDAALLSMQIMKDDDQTRYKDFITAAQLRLDPKYADALPPLKQPDLLALILLNTSSEGLSKSILQILNTQTKARLASTFKALNISPELRLHIIESGVENGLLPISMLQDAYRFYALGQPQKMRALRKKDKTHYLKENSPALRAFLFNKAVYSKAGDMRTDALNVLMILAADADLTRAIAKTLKSHFSSVNPDKGTAHLADLLFPFLYFAGAQDQLCKWQNYISAANMPTTAPMLLMGCSSLNTTYKNHLIQEWKAALLEKYSHDRAGALRYIASVFSILEVMGTSIPLKFWHDLRLQRPYSLTKVPHAQKVLIQKALEKGHKAEVYAVLLKLFGNDPEVWNLDNLLFLIDQLTKVGLKQTVYELAVQMLLTLKLPDAKDAPSP